MDSPDFRAHLGHELAAYAVGLASVDATNAWSTPVPSCPGWAIRDLTHHLIGLHYWVTDAVNGGSGREFGPPMPNDEDLTATFAASATMLQEALDRNPQTPCWTLVRQAQGNGGTVGFWQRRQAHEHAIHRWDLDQSLGLEPTLDPTLSGDGIDEVVTMFWPRQVALGRAEEPAERLSLAAVDTDQTWGLGNLQSAGPPIAIMTGTSADLLLTLWGRIPADSPALTWSGDQPAGAAILGLKIVP